MTLPALHQHRVLVTGGLGALGRAVVATLAERGAQVVALDRAPAQAIDGARRVLGEVELGDPVAATLAVDAAVETLGGLDALVNIAGGFRWETLLEGSVDTWDAMYQVNVRTALAATRAALPHLLVPRSAAIVNVGALAANKAGMGMGAYAASKAGVARFTEALAEELKDRDVRVNAVLPSILDTPVNRIDMPLADTTRWVQPQDLAAVIAFLLSSDAQAITGACIPVAGRM